MHRETAVIGEVAALVMSELIGRSTIRTFPASFG